MAPPTSPLPPGSFLTCSSDDTIRVWSLDKVNEKNSKGVYRQNVYSNVSFCCGVVFSAGIKWCVIVGVAQSGLCGQKFELP